MAKLTPEEQIEFKHLKRELLEYHALGCTHYNTNKERYNELWDKNAKGTLEALNNFERIAKQVDNN
jgi:glutamate racemase